MLRGFVLLSYAVCLVVGRPQYNYEQGNSNLQFEPAPIVAAEAPSFSAPVPSANGQLDQSTLEILRQLSSVPTSPSFLLHESHQTLTNSVNGGQASPALQSVQSVEAAPALPQAQPQFASAPQFLSISSYQPLSQSFADISPSASGTVSNPSVSSESSFAIPSIPASSAPLVLAPAQQPTPAQPSGLYHSPQFNSDSIANNNERSSASFAPLVLAEPEATQSVFSSPPQAAPLVLAQQPQLAQPSANSFYQPAQFSEPITTINADSSSASVASSVLASPPPPPPPPPSAPVQQPQLAQPSGFYQPAQFPEPITTIHKVNDLIFIIPSFFRCMNECLFGQ